MKNKKSNIQTAFEWFALALLFIAVICMINDWLHGSLS